MKASSLTLQPLSLCLLALGLSGCSLLFDTERPQCNQDADCQKLAQDSLCIEGLCRGPLDCLDEEPPPLEGDEVTMLYLIKRASTQEPLAGATVRVCRQLDPDCTDAYDTAVADETGTLHVQVPVPRTNQQVFFEVTADGFMPMLHHPNRAAFDVLGIRTDLLTPLEVAVFSKLGGLAYDPGLAQVVARVTDCFSQRLEGAAFRLDVLDRTTSVYYWVNDVPVSTAQHTDPSGRGGFANAPLGTVTVSSVIEAGGQPINSRTIFTRAGWATETTLGPPAQAEPAD